MKKMVALFIALLGYVVLQAVDDQSDDYSDAIGESSFSTMHIPCAVITRQHYLAAYVAAATRVTAHAKSPGVVAQGDASFFYPDQCVLAIADYSIGDVSPKLCAHFTALPGASSADDVCKILQTITAPASDAMVFIANRNRLFVGTKGPYSRVLIINYEGSTVEYYNPDDQQSGLEVHNILLTSAVQSVVLLRGVLLSNDRVSGIIKEQLAADGVAAHIAEAIIKADTSGLAVAAGVLDCRRWYEALVRIPYDAENLSAVKVKALADVLALQPVHHKQPVPPKKGCCVLL